MKRVTVIDTDTLIRYAERDLNRSEENEIAQQIQRTPQAKARLAEIERMMHHLRYVEETSDGIDFAPLVRTALARDTRRRGTRWTPMVAACLAACLAVSLAIYFHWSPSQPAAATNSPQFRVKGETGVGTEREKWTNLTAYVTDGTATSQLLGPTMKQGDALLFSYTNNGRIPFTYIMIFAVDSAGAVYWYFPGFHRVGTDPVSIPIETDARDVELKELVRHQMAPGTLMLFGLFTDEAVPVSRIEQIVKRLTTESSSSLNSTYKFPFEDCAQHLIQTTIE